MEIFLVASGVSQKDEIVIPFTFPSEPEAARHALEMARRFIDSRLARDA